MAGSFAVRLLKGPGFFHFALELFVHLTVKSMFSCANSSAQRKRAIAACRPDFSPLFFRLAVHALPVGFRVLRTISPGGRATAACAKLQKVYLLHNFTLKRGPPWAWSHG